MVLGVAAAEELISVSSAGADNVCLGCCTLYEHTESCLRYVYAAVFVVPFCQVTARLSSAVACCQQ
jgi:hypothetical protein